MDSRPLDIRVSSVNSALPCEKTCKTGQSIGDQTLISHLTDTRDTDNDSQQQMGKITSSGLKRTACAKDTSSLMAPQKWSQETLIPSRIDMITSKLGELVQDIQIKGLDVNLQKIIGTNVKGANHKDISQINVDNDYHYSACDQLFNGFTEDAKNLTDIKLERKIETADVFIYAALVLDHPYALSSCPLLSPSSEDGDVGCDSNSQSEETDQSCQNLSRDCNYLKLGVSEAFPVSALDVNRKLNGFSKSQSPSPSISSSTTDINSKSSHSLLSGDDYSDIGSGINSPGSPSFHNITACPVKPADVDGKFRTRSFSFNNLELGKLLSNRENTTRKRFDSGIPSDHHSNRYDSMHSPPPSSPNIHPLLRSPASDWDRSEADSETQEDSSDAKTPHRMSPYFTDKAAEWSHPVFHDHDYYAKSTDFISSAIDFRKCRRGKRNYTVKNKLDRINREKIMNSKYLKKELLRKENFIKSASGLEPASADTSVIKTNPVGRPRKRQLDKVVDEIDPETGTKLKITGKFKDQYVYYLSKSSRTTARARHTLTPSSKSDRIIVPATNPGDIVIPHLTDADIEELRLKGCNANTLTEKSQRNPSSSTQPLQPFTTSCNASSESVSDVDSHIVSTILSMENDNIGSAEMQETSDIINTSGLNPNQPALTESLRLMSGDSSITSEHVLNYLLCMVKDEGLLAGVRGFDNCHSALLPSDNTRADHAVEPGNTVCEDLSLLDCGLSSGQDLFEDTKSMACTKPFDSQTLHGSEQVQEIDKLGHNNKYFGDEGVNFPDDLSSFLSEPKGTVSSTSNGYSNSLMKNTFECDFNLFGIPQSSSSIHRLTSIEKTLDYLGVPDEDMKLDCRDSDANMDHGNDSSPVTTSSTFADDTPWIVTITLYFNDVPAIMLNNQPHIRLVDIHKQILPAKDTGILKKRCQLLKIPVLCCTEMQRYFLVQYGRAYNSKSTLIVSKDNATDLVTYYATPQPRNARTFETQKSNPEKNRTALNGKLPVDHIPSDVIKRHVIKGSRKTSDLTSLSSKDHEDSPMQLSQKDKLQKTEALTAHSNRTRHKKINYLELLKGEEKSSNAAAGAGMSLSPDHDKSLKMYVKKAGKMSLPCSDMEDVINRKFTNIHQKKNRQMDGERGKFSRTKKRSKHNRAVEQEVNVCSETDSDGCVNLAQSKKCKPLKLKVNTLLNFVRQRTGSSVSKHSLSSCNNSAATTDRSSRVLSVVHQAALADNSTESSLPSQAADIHLDLFVKPNSSCVCCATCSQFLSVPHFMRHHHVPLDDELLSTKATQRVLAPRNKENISQQEQQLWTEFHRLQEAIGGFGEADDETDSDGSEDQCSLDLSNGDHISLKSPETSVSSHQHLERPSLSTKAPGLSSPSWDSSLIMKDDKNHSFLLYKKLSTISKPAYKRCGKLSSEIHTGLAQQSVDTSALSDAELQTYIEPGASNTRTSTRKRKSKQFFSIENYYTPKRWVVGEEFISQKHVRT